MTTANIDDYDYALPPDLIAQEPLHHRSDARLLVVRRSDQSIEHAQVRDLGAFLSAGDCLVVNDTKVIPARLLGRRTATGGRWEGLFLNCRGERQWQIMSKTRGRLNPGETVTLQNRAANADILLRLLLKLQDGSWIVQPETDEPWLDVLNRVGYVPLPPYIRGGKMTVADWETYQTTFADKPGAVAAPTAGLHFTQPLFDKLNQRGIVRATITLHVGAGTFRPISTINLHDHQMHSEWGSISPATAAQLRACRQLGGRIVAVGTTTTRLLETAAAAGQIEQWTGETDLFIRPPYQFRAVDALMTNFHLPKSTLLVLVRTFGGDQLIKRAYKEAIGQRYRFYSYGDAMLIV